MIGMGRWSLVFAMVLSACGGDDAPPGDDPAAGLRPVPDVWGDADQFAVAMLAHQTKDPRTLMDPVCTITAQVVSSSGSLGLPVTDREGSCIVTAADSLDDVTASLGAECGGDLSFRFGAASRRVSTCTEMIAAPFEVPCDEVNLADQLTVAADGMGMLGTFEVLLQRPALPVITGPMPQGDGTAVWPMGSDDVEVTWAAGDGDAVEVVIKALAGGPAVRCISEDDGTVTVAGRLLGTLRTATASLEVVRISQMKVDSGGYETRASFTVSNSIQLFVRR